MTREEFESILEEAYIEGYNTAIEDIQEDILDEKAYDLEDEYEYYNEAWKPSEFKSKEAEEEAKKHKAGFFNLGKNKADFVRTHTIPKLYEKLKNGSTFGSIAKEVDTENKVADKYYKPGHAGHQLNDYAHRVSRYLLHKAKNSKK